MGWSAARWRRFYDEERHRLGEAGLSAFFDDAPRLDAPRGVVFPHTRLEATGAFVAAAARAALESGADTILALGVLHGAREADAERVARARAGDAAAIAALRGVHGPGVDGDAGVWREEFSLDGFLAMLALGAARAKRDAPRVIARYPFLVGDDPSSLPGIDALARLAERAYVVATTDPIHHGVGYGTPANDARDPSADATRAWAEGAIGLQLDALRARDFRAFAARAKESGSDFRDVGPALARAAPFERAEIAALALVDYAGVLGAPPPTWVAAALVALRG